MSGSAWGHQRRFAELGRWGHRRKIFQLGERRGGLETRLEADTELIKNRLYLGFNVLYEPETTRADLGMWNNKSTFGVSSALAFQIVPKVTIGADLWYLSHYDGAAFNSFTGDAFYLGPTFYWEITPKLRMSAAWETQIAGREVGVSSALDLMD